MAKEKEELATIETFQVEEDKRQDKQPLSILKGLRDASVSRNINHKYSLRQFMRAIAYATSLVLILVIVIPILIGKPLSSESTESLHRAVKVINSFALLPILGNATVSSV